MGQEIDVALLIANLSGYTAFTKAHGALEAANTVTRYVEIAQAALQPGARLIVAPVNVFEILTRQADSKFRNISVGRRHHQRYDGEKE